MHTIEPKELKARLTDGEEIALLDVREHGQYGEGHPFFAVPMPYSRLELLAPRLLPERAVPIVLLDDADGVADLAARRLAALGFASIAVVAGGAPAWAAAGFTLFKGVNLPSKAFGEMVEHARHTPSLSAEELARRVDEGEDLVILDGRSPEEYSAFTIPGAISCPNAELAHRVGDLAPDPKTLVVVNCAGRTRSIIGAQTLIDAGAPNPVLALRNGTQGWRLAGLDLECGADRLAAAAPGAETLARSRAKATELIARDGIPTVDRAALERWRAEAGRTTYLFDVRGAGEFAAGHLPGASHAPGGQLVQATDQWVAVRGARIVLSDDTNLRAAVTARWLRAMGHDAAVLGMDVTAESDLKSGATPAALPDTVASLRKCTPAEAKSAIGAGARLIDVNPSMTYRKAHVAGGEWAIRPRLGRLTPALEPDVAVILAAADGGIATLAAVDLREMGAGDLAWLPQAAAEWQAGGLAVESTPDRPADADCIDFLFFVHDRHAGNLDAARAYLAWETGLIDQMDEDERAVFRL